MFASSFLVANQRFYNSLCLFVRLSVTISDWGLQFATCGLVLYFLPSVTSNMAGRQAEAELDGMYLALLVQMLFSR